MRLLLPVTLSLVFVVNIGCSERSTRRPEVAAEPTDQSSATAAPEGGDEDENQPPADEIGEDCVAFVRSTTAALPAAVPAAGNADCPQCAVDRHEVLKFESLKIGAVTPAGGNVEVNLAVTVSFNSSVRAPIEGGLVGKIPAEQRETYLEGKVPEGTHVYNLRALYRRHQGHWRVIEFE